MASVLHNQWGMAMVDVRSAGQGILGVSHGPADCIVGWLRASWDAPGGGEGGEQGGE